ncbi:MAG: GNAT family N-acetyltransferase [Saprospiraceae bacterium]|nr:GNAT family N-acetyltransferase [Saprospiraceae bacterium]
MKLEYLADNQELLPIVAQWYFEEWGYLSEEKSLEKDIQRLHIYLNKDKVPLMLLAIEEDELLGAAQLKFREMSIYPEKEHWVGGVYVVEKHRGKGIARQILSELIAIAKSLEVETLYLQTENLEGGLYRRMGWKPIEQVNYRGIAVLVMEKHIKE